MSFFDFDTYNIPEPKDLREVPTQHALIILVDKENYTEKDAELLSKILGSVQQDLEYATVLTLAKDEVIKMGSESKNHLIISFGLHPKTCHLQIEASLYKPIVLQQNTYIFSRTLSELPEIPTERRALWNSLKLHYNIS